VDVPCLHFVSVFLGCLIVMHVLMAVYYPLSDVFSRVVHDFIHSHMGDKCIQIGIKIGFVKNSFWYCHSELRLVSLH